MALKYILYPHSEHFYCPVCSLMYYKFCISAATRHLVFASPVWSCNIRTPGKIWNWKHGKKIWSN